MDDTRDRLLKAASQVFAEKGYEKATVREICQAADVNNLASVNYYFRDKEGLYVECVTQAHRARIDAVPLPTWPAGTSPEDKLRGFVATMVARMIGGDCQPWHEQLMMREVVNPTTAVVELVRAFIRPHFDLLLDIIDEIVPAKTPEKKRHQMAFSIVGQCLHYKVARPIVNLLVGEEEMASYTPEALAEHITAFSLAALRGLSCGNKNQSSDPPTKKKKHKRPPTRRREAV